jgi:hypothetical protein
LKFNGNDAYEFMEKFMKEFNIDFSNFDFTNYFSSKGFDLFGILKSAFTRKGKKIKTLTLRNLENTIITGSLT